MGSQITLTMSIVFIVLFIIAIFGFAIGFAYDNDAVVNIADDSQLSSFYSEIEDSASNLDEESEDTYKSILEPLEPGSEVAQSPGRFSGSIRDLLNIVRNAIFIPYRAIFGSGKGFAVFFTVFGSIIALLFALYLYKTLRGNP